MTWTVTTHPASPRATLTVGNEALDVIVGRSGGVPAAAKKEGDGATPLGTWHVLYGLYRADRVAQPAGELPWLAIQPAMGWCDAPADPLYNQPVPLGYPASHEQLWRDDHAYDVILVLNHNQGPVVPGAGSAVFVHVWQEGATHTDGCIALPLADLLRLATDLTTGATVTIQQAA